MGETYPELKNQEKIICKVIKEEETSFFRTLEQGIKRIEQLITDVKSKGETTIEGTDVFELYDTYGFPLDLTSLIAKEHEIQIDSKGFKTALENQKNRSRNASIIETDDWINVHKDQFKRLGVIGDWENYYSTMSFDAEAQIVRELGKFLKQGSLYRGYKPVLWSTVEKTALADAEVEYQDHVSDTIYAAFLVKSSNIKEIIGSNIIIWTTTPWTIPANKALAYNQSLDYVLCEIKNKDKLNNEKIIIAKELLESVSKDTECKINIVSEFKGKEFEGTICGHPFHKIGYDYDVPMLEARFVTTEQGTGIVHLSLIHI